MPKHWILILVWVAWLLASPVQAEGWEPLAEPKDIVTEHQWLPFGRMETVGLSSRAKESAP